MGGNWPGEEMGYAIWCPYDACGANSGVLDDEDKTKVLYEVLRPDLVLLMSLFDEAEYVARYRDIKVMFASKPRHVEVMRVELELYRVTRYNCLKRWGGVTGDPDLFSWLHYRKRCGEYQHDNVMFNEYSASFESAKADYNRCHKSGGDAMKRVLSRVAYMSTAKEMPYFPNAQSYKIYYEDKKRCRLYGEMAFSTRRDMVRSVKYRTAGRQLVEKPSSRVGDITERVCPSSDDEDETEIGTRV